MAKIDELVKQIKDELLDKEMNLDDLDNRIKEIFKTKKVYSTTLKTGLLVQKMDLRYDIVLQLKAIIEFI